ncbi:hypothetical protein [Rhodococcus sp. KRD162]|uniref:hypothetical protein n=1 Tax=Rhodococcus sp. KRD162 TaxID=2729725 RepID=UPI0019D204FD|nr:hypothetical protein [Rhodococcus sp. KRD162]
MPRLSPFALYSTIEQHVNPRLQDALDTDEFAQALRVVHTCRRTVGRMVGNANTWALHAVNMPARSDISRLTRHVGELDREVRKLRLALSSREDGFHV